MNYFRDSLVLLFFGLQLALCQICITNVPDFGTVNTQVYVDRGDGTDWVSFSITVPVVDKWLGFGFPMNEDEPMISADAVVTIPPVPVTQAAPTPAATPDPLAGPTDAAEEVPDVQLVRLNGKTVQQVRVIPNDPTQISGVRRVESDGQTTFTFRRPLASLNRRMKDIVFGENEIIWAIGSGDELAIHATRGFDTTITVDENNCEPVVEEEVIIDDEEEAIAGEEVVTEEEAVGDDTEEVVVDEEEAPQSLEEILESLEEAIEEIMSEEVPAPQVSVPAPVPLPEHPTIGPPTPPPQVNEWTLSPTGAECFFDPDRTDCAQCAPGGCQCGEASPHVCIECGGEFSDCLVVGPSPTPMPDEEEVEDTEEEIEAESPTDTPIQTDEPTTQEPTEEEAETTVPVDCNSMSPNWCCSEDEACDCCLDGETCSSDGQGCIPVDDEEVECAPEAQCPDKCCTDVSENLICIDGNCRRSCDSHFMGRDGCPEDSTCCNRGQYCDDKGECASCSTCWLLGDSFDGGECPCDPDCESHSDCGADEFCQAPGGCNSCDNTCTSEVSIDGECDVCGDDEETEDLKTPCRPSNPSATCELEEFCRTCVPDEEDGRCVSYCEPCSECVDDECVFCQQGPPVVPPPIPTPHVPTPKPQVPTPGTDVPAPVPGPGDPPVPVPVPVPAPVPVPVPVPVPGPSVDDSLPVISEVRVECNGGDCLIYWEFENKKLLELWGDFFSLYTKKLSLLQQNEYWIYVQMSEYDEGESTPSNVDYKQTQDDPPLAWNGLDTKKEYDFKVLVSDDGELDPDSLDWESAPSSPRGKPVSPDEETEDPELEEESGGGSSGGCNRDCKIAVGVVVPIVVLLIAGLLFYFCYWTKRDDDGYAEPRHQSAQPITVGIGPVATDQVRHESDSDDSAHTPPAQRRAGEVEMGPTYAGDSDDEQDVR